MARIPNKIFRERFSEENCDFQQIHRKVRERLVYFLRSNFIYRVELYPPVTAWNNEITPHNDQQDHEDHFSQQNLQSLDQPPQSKPSNAKAPTNDKIFFSIGFVTLVCLH